jgi:hypothetical protein
MASHNSPEDPLFYLHHAYIDLQWATAQRQWTKLGLDQFNAAFPNSGKFSSRESPLPGYNHLTFSSIVDIEKLCYTYDKIAVTKIFIPPAQKADETTPSKEKPVVTLEEVEDDLVITKEKLEEKFQVTADELLVELNKSAKTVEVSHSNAKNNTGNCFNYKKFISERMRTKKPRIERSTAVKNTVVIDYYKNITGQRLRKTRPKRIHSTAVKNTVVIDYYKNITGQRLRKTRPKRIHSTAEKNTTATDDYQNIARERLRKTRPKTTIANYQKLKSEPVKIPRTISSNTEVKPQTLHKRAIESDIAGSAIDVSRIAVIPESVDKYECPPELPQSWMEMNGLKQHDAKCKVVLQVIKKQGVAPVVVIEVDESITSTDESQNNEETTVNTEQGEETTNEFEETSGSTEENDEKEEGTTVEDEGTVGNVEDETRNLTSSNEINKDEISNVFFGTNEENLFPEINNSGVKGPFISDGTVDTEQAYEFDDTSESSGSTEISDGTVATDKDKESTNGFEETSGSTEENDDKEEGTTVEDEGTVGNVEDETRNLTSSKEINKDEISNVVFGTNEENLFPEINNSGVKGPFISRRQRFRNSRYDGP